MFIVSKIRNLLSKSNAQSHESGITASKTKNHWICNVFVQDIIHIIVYVSNLMPRRFIYKKVVFGPEIATLESKIVSPH